MELVEARNQAEALIHSSGESLTEYGDKIDAGEKEQDRSGDQGPDDAIKDDDKATIDAKTQALAQASQKLGEKMYAEAQAKKAAPPRRAAGRAASHPRRAIARRRRQRRRCGVHRSQRQEVSGRAAPRHYAGMERYPVVDTLGVLADVI